MLNKNVIKEHKKKINDIVNSKSLTEFLLKLQKGNFNKNHKRILVIKYKKKHPKISTTKIKYEWAKLRGVHRKPRTKKARLQYYNKRTKQHNYRPQGVKRVLVSKDEFTVILFIKMNIKTKSGEYKYKESYMARYFKTSLSSISYWRRKHILTLEILNKLNMSKTMENQLIYMTQGERPLLKLLRSIE